MAEPEWDDQTRDLVLALDAGTCAVCGGPAEVCQDLAAEYAWRVDAPVRCHRKTRLLEQQDRFKDHDHPEALMFGMRLDHQARLREQARETKTSAPEGATAGTGVA